MSVAKVRHSDAPLPRLFAASALAALTAAALLVAADAHAARRVDVDRAYAANGGPIAVEVKVGGRTTPLFLASNRPDRWYLEAREGAKYEIRVRNTTGQRIGFVLAVDGLNAIDGRRTRNAADEPMYVLDPYASSTIKGWRKSLDNVSRFVFVDERRSYAERTGQGNGDLGWIRVTAFHEERSRGDIRWRAVDPGDGWDARDEARAREQDAPAAPEAGRRANGMGTQSKGEIAPAPSQAPMADANPGTGWGPNQRDRVRTVDFEPRPYAAAQVILRYEYKPALVALGILPWRERDRTWERENGLYGFAQPPRGW